MASPLPQTKEELTKTIALNLQMWLTAWHELYPEDTDADACSKSLDMIEFELEDLMTRPDPPTTTTAPDAAEPKEEAESALPTPEPTDSSPREEDDDEWFDRMLRPKRQERANQSFRQMLIEIARRHPTGFDITTAVEDAEAQGFTHPTPRNLVSVTASGLVRGGILVRRDRGTYALSPAFLGAPEQHDEDD